MRRKKTRPQEKGERKLRSGLPGETKGGIGYHVGQGGLASKKVRKKKTENGVWSTRDRRGGGVKN